ncbi:hypothetical protein [Hyphomonas sp.]|uniref:hypothetical protein n=1 Tax=Hyphomonas sp. TaxID=87 RepID=UPI00391B1B29
MLRPAALTAALAAMLSLTAFGGGNRMNFEMQPGRWLVYESLMLDGKYVEEIETEICLTRWTQRTPEQFLAMAARGATCEITSRKRDVGMLDLTYTCTDGPVQEGKIRIGASIDDMSVMAEADYTLDDGSVVPAYIDTMFLHDGPCPAPEEDAAPDEAPA